MHAIPEISEQWRRWVSAIVACFVFVSRFLCIHFCSRAINCDVRAECASSFSKRAGHDQEAEIYSFAQ